MILNSQTFHSGEPSAHDDESDAHRRLLRNALPKERSGFDGVSPYPGRPVAIALVLVHD